MRRAMRMSVRSYALVAPAALCAMISLGCAASSLEGVREHTYPPDFHYITQGEILTTMGLLASVSFVAIEPGFLDFAGTSFPPLSLFSRLFLSSRSGCEAV